MIYYFTSQGFLKDDSNLNILDRVMQSKLKPKNFKLADKEQNKDLNFD